MPLWVFNKAVWFVLAAMLGAYSCPPTWRSKLRFAYILLTSDSYAQMCCKRYHIIFSTFPLKFKRKTCVWKEVIHKLIHKSHFGHVTSYELTHFKKMVRVWKTKSLLFCLGYDPLIVFRSQNHITFIFIKTVSHVLLGQMTYYTKMKGLDSGKITFIAKQPKINRILITRLICVARFQCHDIQNRSKIKIKTVQ